MQQQAPTSHRGGKNCKEKAIQSLLETKAKKRENLGSRRNPDQIALGSASTVCWLGNLCSDELCGVSNFVISGRVLVISFCPKIIGSPRTGVGWWVLGIGKPCCAIQVPSVLWGLQWGTWAL